ncbi:uncharacterized protein [Drosophila virilis]|uniref:Uncharacterized protein n=1 Tax=Drosophila virilis TaxID=7244 RepID=B4MGN8_DROVI|nr:uncharacterized protein LOC6636809 [Drosophila virilis]EDW57104.1 uncharacterized protein Dvir_GJ16054 [Drosophila virilis]
MEKLREKLGQLFTRKYSVDKPMVDEDEEESEELQTKDVVDLMQQQHQQEEKPKTSQKQPKSERESHYDNYKQKKPSPYPLTTADLPVEAEPIANYMDNIDPGINYEMEFVDFIDRNAPQGFGQKLESMLPYLGLSFVTWPGYWVWRGYQWQTKRRTERIGMYIQRTFQHAKLMQVAILSLGLLMATSARSSSEPLEVHEVSYRSKRK